MLSRYIGDRKFYKTAMTVAFPIMVQTFITNFVSMLDNIMVGKIGTVQMSGVAIVNQILFVLNLCIFGAVSGAGIFTAQFAGSGDDEGVRQTFRFKAMSCLALVGIGCGVFILGGDRLVRLFLQGEGDPADVELTLRYGMRYLRVMLWGMVPFALSNVYCSTLRENGETVVPMIAGVSAVAVNLSLNWLLIFDHFGYKGLGVVGAAIATVASRVAELTIAAVWTHTHAARARFAKGLYRTMRVSKELTKKIFRKGTPLMINETLWSAGMTMLVQCYSLRGYDVVAANNICMTLWNAMSVSVMAMGSSIGIIIGQRLGAGRPEAEVRDTDRKLIAFSVAVSSCFAVLMALASNIFPRFYNTTDAVRELAGSLIIIMAAVMPFAAYTNGCYFTLRSGGRTIVTFIFDSMFVWLVNVPLAYCLSRFTALPIIPLYAACQATEAVKCAIGAFMLKKGYWIQTIIKE